MIFSFFENMGDDTFLPSTSRHPKKYSDARFNGYNVVFFNHIRLVVHIDILSGLRKWPAGQN